MNGFVLDCSVTMGWCFGDETNPYSEAVLQGLADTGAMAPSIWPLEMANVLLVAERRKRITKAQSRRFVELLRSLPIAVDDASAERAWDGVLSLARDQNLSAYDAAYLELAMREGLPIATLDQALRRAAKYCGVAQPTIPAGEEGCPKPGRKVSAGEGGQRPSGRKGSRR